jgi:hypothetical protein
MSALFLWKNKKSPYYHPHHIEASHDMYVGNKIIRTKNQTGEPLPLLMLYYIHDLINYEGDYHCKSDFLTQL